jgi:DNA-binding protein Fis
MKRVVVQVGPVEPDSANDESNDAATTVETFVAEENAELLLATVLSLNGRTSLKSSDRIVEILVKRELNKDDEADGLFDRMMTSVERTLLSLVYAECDHVQTRTASRLGIDRNTLHKKLRKHNLLTSEP